MDTYIIYWSILASLDIIRLSATFKDFMLFFIFPSGLRNVIKLTLFSRFCWRNSIIDDIKRVFMILSPIWDDGKLLSHYWLVYFLLLFPVNICKCVNEEPNFPRARFWSLLILYDFTFLCHFQDKTVTFFRWSLVHQEQSTSCFWAQLIITRAAHLSFVAPKQQNKLSNQLTEEKKRFTKAETWITKGFHTLVRIRYM